MNVKKEYVVWCFHIKIFSYQLKKFYCGLRWDDIISLFHNRISAAQTRWHIYQQTDITWAFWHLRSLVTRLFVQQLIQDYTEENIKAPHYWPFVWGVIHQWPVEPNVESVSISQHHHDIETVPSSLPFSFSNETGCRFMVICSIEQCYRFSPVFYGQCHHHRQLKWYFSPTCVNIMIRPRTSWTIYIGRWWKHRTL